MMEPTGSRPSPLHRLLPDAVLRCLVAVVACAVFNVVLAIAHAIPTAALLDHGEA